MIRKGGAQKSPVVKAAKPAESRSVNIPTTTLTVSQQHAQASKPKQSGHQQPKSLKAEGSSRLHSLLTGPAEETKITATPSSSQVLGSKDVAEISDGYSVFKVPVQVGASIKHENGACSQNQYATIKVPSASTSAKDDWHGQFPNSVAPQEEAYVFKDPLKKDDNYSSQFTIDDSLDMAGGMHSNVSLTSWLSTMKDDIDGGLAADFDGSLSGLGVELGTSTYNMSEALLALPVFKQEGEDHGFQYVLMAPTSPATKVNEETLTYLNQGQSYEIKLKKLGASIPSASPQPPQAKSKFLRSVVRVVFHERRLQFMEREQLATWRQTRPGERIVDIDIPLSYGLYDVNVDERKLNSLEIVWDPAKDSAIFIKVHCISTEFTARKHGGEKGVPFRIQLETYRHGDPQNKLLHCSSCQVKVFKPKGADRKNKTDREKVEKRPESEKEKYQPSYECTVLTEIPLEQVETYLEQLRKQEEEDEEMEKRRKEKSRDISSFQCLSDNSSSSFTDSMASPSSQKLDLSFSPTLDTMVMESESKAEEKSAPLGGKKPRSGSLKAEGGPTKASVKTHRKSSIPSANEREQAKAARKLSVGAGAKASKAASTITKCTKVEQSAAKKEILEPDSLTTSASDEEVTKWLQKNRFSAFVKVFQHFSGADLLKLSRDDLIQICGLADGIRLNNCLQHKQIRPKLTIYICQKAKQKVPPPLTHSANLLDIGQIHISNTPDAADTPPQVFTAKQLKEFTVPGFEISNSNPFIITTDTQSQCLQQQLQQQQQQLSSSSAAATSVTHHVSSAHGSSGPAPPGHTDNGSAQTGRDGDGDQAGGGANLPPSFTIPQTEMIRSERDRSPSNSPSPPNHSPHSRQLYLVSSGDGTPQAKVISISHATTAKRQFQDDNSNDSSEYLIKKARTRNLELKRKEIYHAIYLDALTVEELCEHLASLFCVPPSQLTEIHVQGPSGILVIVTDDVVQNLPEQSRYNVEGTQDDERDTICYRVVLRHVP